MDNSNIKSRVIIMTAGGTNPNVMINALSKQFSDIHVIQEEPETKGAILKRRARRLGWITAFGQLGTMVCSRLRKSLATKRSNEIIATYGLDGELHAGIPITRVTSLNDVECHHVVSDLEPAVIFTISCRLLSRATLATFKCPVINFHAGINPRYRGQMGGYWALIENDAGNFGATVHLVDAGVDTGATLYEQRMRPSSSDSISTYPLLITAASTDIAAKAIEDALSGSLSPKKPTAGASALRFPPPVWTWIWYGITRKIW